MIGTKQGEGTTTIGRGASLRGDLKTTGDIVIEGSLDGSLQADESRVSVGREAHVRADVQAREVVVEGHLIGTIRATERVELRSNAYVEGTVYSRRFAMEENAVLRGSVDPSGSTVAPARQEPVYTPSSAPSPAPPTPTPFARPATNSSHEDAPLFPRPAGSSMPAGLAAAARSLGSNSPTGMSALSEEESEHDSQ